MLRLLPFSYSMKRINKRHTLRAISLLLAICLVLTNPILSVYAGSLIQTSVPEGEVQQILDQLTPEERIGQLLLVTFTGTDVGENSQIYDLIYNHHVGGVILKSENSNFAPDDFTLEQLLIMNRQLQISRWESAQDERLISETGETFKPTFVPLFLAISQEGDGYPYNQILSKLTLLPSFMAIGATWDPTFAASTGNVLGKELSALGFNLLIGPSLDIIENPQPEISSGLGTRTFGGDPYWVAQMGRAYVGGFHEGSQGRIALVAKHFPGIGAADRLPEKEVSTVRKSLDQLKTYDLAPFFDVTGNAPTPETTIDALLVSHIRYQGFQGNIRATTRPVSFDQQALKDLMSLPFLASWRDNGGVLISDDLGSLAVRRFFELTNPNQPFDARRVALNAFLAGNDLLYLGDITAGEDPDAYTTTLDVLAFFTQKYREDPAFAQRVDQSVLRVINLKLRLYGTFNLDSILPSIEELEDLGTSEQVAFDIASQAATLISPSLAELDVAIPDPPNQNDRIIFITDTSLNLECSQCPDNVTLNQGALQEAVVRLYGPQAGGLVTPGYMRSYPYEDLERLLNGDPEMFQLENDLRRSHWIVFAMLDVSNDNPTTLSLNRFLAERPDLFQQKRLIVFAFNAPYFLDATNISKLTAYYSLYSKIPSFVDVAARLLFREMQPVGSLPVSVPGVGYDLISATMPDPNQIIPLVLDIPESDSVSATGTPSPIPTPEYSLGSSIPIRTGIIYDHNGHPVPDNTPVTFITILNGEVNSLPQTEITSNGIARTTIQVVNPGTLEIRVESEPAKQSDILRFEFPAENGTIIPETLTPEATIEPTLTATVLSPTEIVIIQQPLPPSLPNLIDWIVATLLAIAIGAFSYRLAAFMGQVRWGVRSGFLALIGGLSAYTYLAMELPGSKNILESIGAWGILLVTLSGSLAGILLTLAWRMIRSGARGEG